MVWSQQILHYLRPATIHQHLQFRFLMRPTLCLAFLFLHGFANAQEVHFKGILGTTVNYLNWQGKSKLPDGSTYDNYSAYQTTVNPYFGYSLNDHWLVGLQGKVSFQSTLYDFTFFDEEVKQTQSTFNGGLFVRYHVGGKDALLRFFLEPNLLYGGYSTHSDGNINISAEPFKRAREFNAYLSTGFAWSVSRRINLVARFGKIGYTTGKGKRPDIFETEAKYHYLDLQLDGRTLLIGAELKLFEEG